MLALFAGPALGQPAPAPDAFQAPAYHAPTKITMATNLGGANLVRSVDYAKAHNDPSLGVSWNYSLPGALGATVQLYQARQTSIPAGAASPLVQAQFREATDEIPQSKKYDQLAPVKAPADCVYGILTFRCSVQSGLTLSNQQRVRIGLMVTGYRNHFLKVRLDTAPTPSGEIGRAHV